MAKQKENKKAKEETTTSDGTRSTGDSEISPTSTDSTQKSRSGGELIDSPLPPGRDT